jgi:hypothetical protein
MRGGVMRGTYTYTARIMHHALCIVYVHANAHPSADSGHSPLVAKHVKMVVYIDKLKLKHV